MLTDNRIRGGRQFNYVIERNWEFVEGLKSSRFNYGMSQKPAEAPTAAEAEPADMDDVKEPPNKRAKRSQSQKHIRFD